MKVKDVALFIYGFPHKKTQDFLLRLFVENYNIKYVIAAPWKKLNISEPKIRISPSHVGLIHPRSLCKKLRIKYIEADHNSKKAKIYIQKNPVDLFIISGARILTDEIISSTKNKILNIHPGLLPENRGLDTLMWAINDNVPLGLTAHFIESKIDAGRMVLKRRIILKKDDTPIDVSLRLLESQNDFLIESLNSLKKLKSKELVNLNNKTGKYNTKMSANLEKKTIKKFPNWIRKFSN